MNQSEISRIANSDFQTFKEFVMQSMPEYKSKESYDYNKVLAERYPFLIPVNAWTGEIDKDYNFEFLEGFWGYGRTELFIRYCEKIKPEFEDIIARICSKKLEVAVDASSISIPTLNELRKNGLPYIINVKEKYGTCRVYWNSDTDKMHEANAILEALSAFTCERCGKVTKDLFGRRIIWQTRGWISNYCQGCFTEVMLHNDKDAKIKKLLKTHKIVHPRHFCFSTLSKDKCVKKFYKDNDDGWLSLFCTKTKRN